MKTVTTISRLLHMLLLLCLTVPISAQIKSKAGLAKQLLQAKSAEIQLSATELSTMRVSSETFSEASGVTNIYFQQYINDIPVHGAILNAHVTKNDELLTYGNRFVQLGNGEKKGPASPTLTAEQALHAALAALGIQEKGLFIQKSADTDPIRTTIFDKGLVSLDDIKIQLIYQPVENHKIGVRLAWQVEIQTTDGQNWWLARMDAETGEFLDKNNYIVHCDFGVADPSACHHKHTTDAPHQTFFDIGMDLLKNDETVVTPPMAPPVLNQYKVYPQPTESPNHTSPAPPADGRTVVSNPASPTASPFGWHDTNGVSGAEFTITRGNNVHAYTDIDANNSPDAGSSPDGGVDLVFNFPIDFTQAPSAYRPAAVTNLFYWNNYIHDFAYAYGFTPINGNFQVNNYGTGGAGNDDVQAEAQDGSGTNNANFGTPPDGQRPRMQMYIGTNPNPDVDGDLDNGVIAHEYAHGISNRFTGGPANVNCLDNNEQMGEGWSDFYALMTTMEPGDQGTDSRGIGTYLFGQPANGPGIRPTPYSTLMSINPSTYNTIKTAAIPHGVGYVWATMIWDLTWAMIADHGQANGFNVAMNLVNEGMRLQVCDPGFVDGRNAILAADLALNGGTNRCRIWEVFARRGLGFSATQGSSNSTTDGTEAFDLPPSCILNVLPPTVTVCSPTSALYTITNGTGATQTLSATGNPAGTTISFSVNPLPNAGTSILTIGNIAAAAPGTYTVTVTGTNGANVVNSPVTLVVHNGNPAAPTLISPANLATNQVNPLLTWSASPNAATYQVQLALDAGFTNIVANPIGLTTASYQTTGLLNLTTYYWRVRAVNSCGTGNYSTPFSFTTANVICGTFNSTDVPKTIATTPVTVLSTLTIPSTCGVISDVNVKNLNITHSWIDDLTVELISPAGTVVRIMDRPCDDENNILINFDDEAASPTFPCPPTNNGTYQPFSLLSAFDGQQLTGTWTLRVIDGFNQDGGSLNAWGLEICYGSQTVTCYRDLDTDTYGNPNNSQSFCQTCGVGYVSNNTDCNDGNTNIHPNAIEICNQVDDDCDILIDEGGVCQSAPCYSLIVGSSPFQDSLWTVDSTTFQVVNRKSPHLASGPAVTGMTGLARHPITGVYYVIAKLSGVNGRVLCTYDLATDILTQVGNLGTNFSSITFSPSGQLFGVTGNGATPPETLFDINPVDATKTLLVSLSNGADGEIICYNPDDNMLYHWSGNGTVTFEKVLPVAPYTVTNIPISGSPNGETFGAVYKGNGKFIISNISSSFNTVTTTGVWSAAYGSNPDDLRGLAFTDALGNTVTCYRDADNDNYGDPTKSRTFCSSCATGYVSTNTDCNDGNSAINPAAVEVCDGIDNNCNGQIDESSTFALPPNGAAQVACPALATQPVPPVVVVCGVNIPPVGPTVTNNPNPLTCEGTKTYNWTYTSGPTTLTWSFVYTVERNDFTVPANGSATVACPALAVAPTPPVVLSNCGETITPTGPVIANVPNPLTCEGTRTYTYTYTDCEGNTHPWSFVYTIERNPFTMPANGSATVSCVGQAVQPTPPTVLSNCGEVITPTGPTIVNNPNPIICAGTRTYTWTYTDCEGNTAQWSFVYTIVPQPFTVPANGGSTVACPDQTDITPVPPVVTNACGDIITPVLTSVTPKNDCEGHRVYTWNYTDCAGNSKQWSYTYLVEYLDFSIPPSETYNVECPLNAFVPVPPVVHDNCNRLLNPTGPEITSNTGEGGVCESFRSYAWTYKDCEGNTHVWSVSFNFQYTADFFVPADETYNVACLVYAQPPAPQTLYDICGQEIVISGPVVTEEIDAEGCSGVRSFTYTYTDCGGHSHNWTFIYFANDNEPPVGLCPSSNGSVAGVSVDETGLTCIEEVPCPDNYDFTSKIQQLLAAGHIYDVCSGHDLVVTLDSWSELWQCSDPDGNGVNTFGRTFYFRIADQCGNEFPDVCAVTYSGVCQPISTFSPLVWGLEGNENGNQGIDLGVIQTLLNNYGPLVVGGGARSLTLTQAQCLVDLLPGQGFPSVLGNCNQTNCLGCNPFGPNGMKNTLATDAIALTLSLYYSIEYNDAGMQGLMNQSLGCMHLNPNIVSCSGVGGCHLHIYDSNGMDHQFPYTIGGLLSLTNLYLGGNIDLNPIQSGVYATALYQSIETVLGNYSGGQSPTTCDPSAGASANNGSSNKSLPVGKPSLDGGVVFSLSPNPANREVTIKLGELATSQEVILEVYNSLGQKVMVRKFGNVKFVNEKIDLSSIDNGIYFFNLKTGEAHFEQKLVVRKG